jgi:Ca2+:H+ antiporter
VLLSEFLAIIVDFGIEDLGLPAPLGGVMIAILVLSPEGLTAFHSVLANQLQRAVNVCRAQRSPPSASPSRRC